MSEDPRKVIAAFREVVNMTARQLEAWLDTAESKEVGYKERGGGESVGHHSGRRIVEILGKNKADYSDDDLKHIPVMAVTAYAGRDDEDRIRAAGAAAYVSKPISLMRFMEAVNALL